MKDQKTKRRRIPIIIALILLLLIAGISIPTVLLMRKNFGRGDYTDRRLSAYYRYEDYADRYDRENVQFTSGKNTLQGYIYGSGNDKGLIVFAHGIGTGHESYLNQLLWFVDAGWCVFTYDATGSGSSEGSGTRGLVQSVIDLDLALSFAEQDARLADMPCFVMGHSWGGFAAAAILDYPYDITASASISGYAYPMDMLDKGAADALGSTFAPVFHFAARSYQELIFGKDASRNAVDAINGSQTPILLIHGDDDAVVPYDTCSILSYRSALTNPIAEYITVSGAYAGHSDLLYSDAANAYSDDFKEHYNEVKAQYPDGVPDDVCAEEIAKTDQVLVNEPNAELMAQIDAFFSQYLP